MPSLAEMMTYIQQEKINLHSLIVSRYGKTLMEAYFYPYTSQSVHDVRSVAKSILALLIGIAIEKGQLQNIHQPVLDFFPERQFANTDSRKEAITIAHLLHMSSGLEWSDADVPQMMQSKDWLQFVLDGKMTSEPGNQFVYSTLNTYVLSAILQKTTSMTALEFARQNLFDTIELGELRWQTDPTGINMGGMGMWMTSLDMLKIGQFVLHKGVWDKQQVISEAWITECTTSPDGEYAYLWWSDVNSIYAAGYGGQMIYIVPHHALVVVFTAGLADATNVTKKLLNEFIIPAVQEVTAPEEANLLAAQLHHVAHPISNPIPPLNDTARRISGKTYHLNPNIFNWTYCRLDFQSRAARIFVEMSGDKAELPIGMDGIVQVQPGEKLGLFSDHDPIGLTGHWENENSFFLRFEILNNPESWNIHFNFENNLVDIEMKDMIQGHVEKIQGKW